MSLAKPLSVYPVKDPSAPSKECNRNGKACSPDMSRPFVFLSSQLWLAAPLMWPTPSCVLAHAHVWHRIVPGCTTAEVNMCFIGGKMVVFLSYAWGRAVAIHTFSPEAEEATRRLNKNKRYQSFFFGTLVGCYTLHFMSLLRRHLLAEQRLI